MASKESSMLPSFVTEEHGQQSISTEENHSPPYEVPRGFYWPYRFVPETDGSIDCSNEEPTLNQLCPKCVVIRDWIVSNFDEREARKFGHYGFMRDLINSAHKGCHLCSILYTTSATAADGDFFWKNPEQLQQDLYRYDVVVNFVTFAAPGEGGQPKPEAGRYVYVFPEGHDIWGKVQSRHGYLPYKYAKISKGRPPAPIANYSSYTSSPAVQSWATGQVSQCLSQHMHCSRLKQKLGAYMPTRLIDLKSGSDKSQLCLVSGVASEPEEAEYSALSYCWGGDQDFKLTAGTKNELYKGFGLESLPKTVRDAVCITRWLNIRYLWVDALCIIQDDVVDWNREAKKMDEVYRGSVVTIAAQGATHSAEGCFAVRSQLMHQPCKLKELTNEVGIFVDFPRYAEFHGRDAVPESPLCTRAWTVQERHLCPRILYFGATLRFECSETLQGEFSGPIEYDEDNVNRAIPDKWFTEGTPNDSQKDLPGFYTQWGLLVTEYTGSQLTFPSDRTVALQGVIRHWENCTGFENLAGIWRSRLPLDLLWTTHPEPASREKANQRMQYAPSWTWLTMDTAVCMPYEYSYQHFVSPLFCEVLIAKAKLVSHTSNLGGSVWEGELHLRSYLSRIQGPSTTKSGRWWDILFDQQVLLRGVVFADSVVDCETTELFFFPIGESHLKELQGLILRRSETTPNAYERVGVIRVNATVLPSWEFGKTTIVLV